MNIKYIMRYNRNNGYFHFNFANNMMILIFDDECSSQYQDLYYKKFYLNNNLNKYYSLSLYQFDDLKIVLDYVK